MMKYSTAVSGSAVCGILSGAVALIVAGLSLPPMVIAFWRGAIAALTLLVFLWATRRHCLLHFPGRAVILPGFLLASQWGLYFAALKSTSIISAVLVASTAPILIALLSPLILHKKSSAASMAALPLSLGATVMILTGGPGGGSIHPLGVLLSAGSAVAHALLIIYLKRDTGHIDPVTLIFYESLVATVVLAPFSLMKFPDLNMPTLGRLFLLGVVFTTGLGIAFQFFMRHVNALDLGILSYLDPGASTVLAVVISGEPFTARLALGGVAVLFSGGLVAFGTQQQGFGNVPERRHGQVSGGHPGHLRRPKISGQDMGSGHGRAAGVGQCAARHRRVDPAHDRVGRTYRESPDPTQPAG
jgi:drug/metabolite transporter (DMT)-like permease